AGAACYAAAPDTHQPQHAAEAAENLGVPAERIRDGTATVLSNRRGCRTGGSCTGSPTCGTSSRSTAASRSVVGVVQAVEQVDQLLGVGLRKVRIAVVSPPPSTVLTSKDAARRRPQL